MTIQETSSYDIFRWPDGTLAYRWQHSRGDYDHMSDDFEVVPYNSVVWLLLESECQ